MDPATEQKENLAERISNFTGVDTAGWDSMTDLYLVELGLGPSSGTKSNNSGIRTRMNIFCSFQYFSDSGNQLQ